MSQKQTPTPVAPGMSLGDVYHIVFRRKWVILGTAVCGFIAAGLTFSTWNTTYSSVAQIYIPSIRETVDPGEKMDTVRVESTGSGSPLSSELIILNSLDSMKAVADYVTPARIMARYVSGTNVTLDQAAQTIQNNLVVDSPHYSQIITLTFSSRSPEIVQTVLDQVITNYIKKELAIHQHDISARVTQDYDMQENKLKDTEAAIAKIKTENGIVSLPEAEAMYRLQEGDAQRDDEMTMAELAACEGRIKLLQKLLPSTNETTTTNVVDTGILDKPSDLVLNDYKRAQQNLVDLQTKLAELQISYNTNNMRVQTNMIEIEEAKAKLKSLETSNPGLVAVAQRQNAQNAGTVAAYDPVAAYHSELAMAEGYKAQHAELLRQLQLFQDKGTNFNRVEVLLEDLERVEASAKAYLVKISADMNEVSSGNLRDDQVSNINVVQSPSPPVSDLRKSYKAVQGIAVGGVIFGFGLAFLWELIFDRSLKRPKEVSATLKLPFILNIPYLKNRNGNSRFHLFKPGRKAKLLSAGSGDPAAPASDNGALAATQNNPVSPWDENPALRPFHETLRDRLIAYFEMINLTHKPKLVAITACADGAGVSTIASGLARSLSETGEGNVLLVDMNSSEGAAHHFYKGQLAMGLADILEKQKANRQEALVQDNLYVVKESSQQDKLPSFLPKRFSHLVSQLKASDYDYILLDMPPVTEISITPRLARFMDMILLVVESEKTGADAAQRAATLLAETRSNVGVVMNKTRNYVPKWLQHEL